MVLCHRCGNNVCKPCVFSPAAQPKITVACNNMLSRPSHVQRLAVAARALDLSRREFPNWMADVIFNFKGEVDWPSGDVFVVEDEDIDAAFNDDGSFRWLSDFLAFADLSPRQRPQARILDRLRLIDLAFRIAYPERAKWIAK